MTRKAKVTLAIVFALIVWTIAAFYQSRHIPPRNVQRPSQATDSPCGSIGQGEYYLLFPMDADAGSTPGRGWVKMFRCSDPDDRMFVQHWGTNTPFILLTAGNTFPYQTAMNYARDRGRVIKVVK